MLIKALNEYYDILAKNGKVCPNGFSKQKISYMIMLRPDGTISDIIDIREESEPDGKGKTNRIPVDMILPKRTEKPGIDGNIIEHRPLYIFGLNYDKKSGSFSTEDATGKAKNSHNAFVRANMEYTEGMSSDIVSAYRNFIQKWKPQEETENEQLIKLGKEYSTACFCFALDGHPEITLHDADGEIYKKVSENARESGDTENEGICAVTGERGEVARLHNKIKGVLGAKQTGASLVCFKNSAVESYGKTQSYNSSVSEKTMKRYTETLNILLSDRNHRAYLDDMTILFWAMSPDDSEETDLFASVFGFDNGKADSARTDMILKSAVNEISLGREPDLSGFDIDEGVEFYIVGLSPNAARISQKFIYRDKFGSIFDNAARHQSDMLIDGSKGNVSMWRLFSELKSPKSTNEKIPPPLAASLFNAILGGGKYPVSLLEKAVRRVKTDKDKSVNYIRAGIIKAYLNRYTRYYKKEEEIKMALDKENTNQAYLCGRLFAVLEKIQQNASGGNLNRTIKDSYFASACAKPAAVFPKLLKLAQYHLNKDEYAKSNNILIGEITDKLRGEFPQTLPLTEQGKFIIGYYQQYQDFFKKSESKTQSE